MTCVVQMVDMESFGKYSFGRKLLESHGWKSGKGLGKDESGISEALKPTLKFDKAGVGHNQGDDFSFHWWDHVYKKAANNIVVEHSEDGVAMRQKEAQVDLISTKKWKHKKKKKKSTSAEHKPLTYGVFKKSATLTQDGEMRENTAAAQSSDDDDDDHLFHHADQDNVAFKLCEGRTAHKGARHGLTASGKLMRLEAQEMRLTAATDQRVHGLETGLGFPISKKRKSCLSNGGTSDCPRTGMENGSVRKKKKKRKPVQDDGEMPSSRENGLEEEPTVENAMTDGAVARKNMNELRENETSRKGKIQVESGNVAATSAEQSDSNSFGVVTAETCRIKKKKKKKCKAKTE